MVGVTPLENKARVNLSHLNALFSNNPDGFVLYSSGKMEFVLLAMEGQQYEDQLILSFIGFM